MPEHETSGSDDGSTKRFAPQDLPNRRVLAAGVRVFGRYVLKAIVGRGGMGVVWRARDETLETDVALKFLPELVAHDPAAVNDLKRETRRSLQLTHPNIVRIFDFVQDEHSAAISMEFVDGATLTQLRLKRPKQIFEPAELSNWVKQLCEALNYAHTKAKVVHRDLKPSNLMVNAQGDLSVADFGISATLTDATGRTSTVAGSSGTLAYMSPQQMTGEKPAPTDDIYSLGATLHELLTGKPPFHTGRIEMQVLQKMVPGIGRRRQELGISGESIPPDWEQTIAACLAKESQDRPQSAGEVARRLKLGENSFVVQAERRAQDLVGSASEPHTDRIPSADTAGVALGDTLEHQAQEAATLKKVKRSLKLRLGIAALAMLGIGSAAIIGFARYGNPLYMPDIVLRLAAAVGNPMFREPVPPEWSRLCAAWDTWLMDLQSNANRWMRTQGLWEGPTDPLRMTLAKFLVKVKQLRPEALVPESADEKRLFVLGLMPPPAVHKELLKKNVSETVAQAEMQVSSIAKQFELWPRWNELRTLLKLTGC